MTIVFTQEEADFQGATRSSHLDLGNMISRSPRGITVTNARVSGFQVSGLYKTNYQQRTVASVVHEHPAEEAINNISREVFHLYDKQHLEKRPFNDEEEKQMQVFSRQRTQLREDFKKWAKVRRHRGESNSQLTRTKLIS